MSMLPIRPESYPGADSIRIIVKAGTVCTKCLLPLFLLVTLFASCSGTGQLAESADRDGTINIRDFGAAGDGMTDDSSLFRDALDRLGESESTLVVPRGTYVVTEVTIPDNVTLSFRNGGILRVPDGGRAEINGTIDAGLTQVFSGSGGIVGTPRNMRVFPQWFGARGDGQHDDSEALQRAADLAAASAGRTLFIPGGEYRFDQDVVVRSHVDSRGVLVKVMEVDEEQTVFSYDTFVPTHFSKRDPMIRFAPDHEKVELDALQFFGIEKGETDLPAYRDVRLAEGEDRTDLSEGGTIRFHSSDYFTSRQDRKGDSFYDRNDISQIVSGRGEVFPEFAFSYPAPMEAEEWTSSARYDKGDYVTRGGRLFKATWASGEGAVYEHPHLGTARIGPVRPQDQSTVRQNLRYEDGTDDDIVVWRQVETRVWYREKDAPVTVNDLRVEVRLAGHEGEAKRLQSGGTVRIERSNMTFLNPEISVRDPEALLARLFSSRNSVNIEVNGGYFSGSTFPGLGYNIHHSNVANFRYNHTVSTNSRKGMDGRHGKNVTITGGYYNVIEDHYGRNYVIRDAVLTGRGTDVPGYMTPDADLQNWEVRMIRAIGFAGDNLHVENVTVNIGSGGIGWLAWPGPGTPIVVYIRGDGGGLGGDVVLRNITVNRNRGDVRLFTHSKSGDFDFVHDVSSPDRMIIEDVRVASPGRINLVLGDGYEYGSYGPVDIRNSSPIGDVRSASASMSFNSCGFQDSEFQLGPGPESLAHVFHCTFSGRVNGLESSNIGRSHGNRGDEDSMETIPPELIESR